MKRCSLKGSDRLGAIRQVGSLARRRQPPRATPASQSQHCRPPRRPCRTPRPAGQAPARARMRHSVVAVPAWPAEPGPPGQETERSAAGRSGSRQPRRRQPPSVTPASGTARLDVAQPPRTLPHATIPCPVPGTRAVCDTGMISSPNDRCWSFQPSVPNLPPASDRKNGARRWSALAGLLRAGCGGR